MFQNQSSFLEISSDRGSFEVLDPDVRGTLTFHSYACEVETKLAYMKMNKNVKCKHYLLILPLSAWVQQ